VVSSSSKVRDALAPGAEAKSEAGSAHTVAIACDDRDLGGAIARRWLEASSGRVIIVAPDASTARAQASALPAADGDDRIEARSADAARAEAIAEAVRGADWLVIALDDLDRLPPIIEGALRAGASCVDLGTTPGRDAIWAKYRDRFVEAGKLVITEAGVQPGLPGVLLRSLTRDRPAILRLDLATALRPRCPPGAPMPPSTVGLLRRFVVRPTVYASGYPALDLQGVFFPYRYFWFHAPFGKQTVSPAGPMPEVAAVAAENPHIRRIRCVVGGLDATTMWVGLPLIYPLLVAFGRWLRPLLAKFLYYGFMRRFSTSPHGVALRGEATGHVDARASVEIQHDDEHALAADVVSTLLHRLEGAGPEPGVHLMAYAVGDPDAFLERLETLGARLHRGGHRATERSSAALPASA
jgi:hypothetical protein